MEKLKVQFPEVSLKDLEFYNEIIYSCIAQISNKDYCLANILYTLFIRTCIWKQEKSLCNLQKNSCGIYVLYNRVTLAAYVGESVNIERRFFEHYTQLVSGSHFNKGLLEAVSTYGIDSIEFFIFDCGEVYNDSNFRREKEVSLMNTWPGPVYNVKDIYKRTRLSVKS